MGPVLWAVVQDKPMAYEQVNVVDALAMRHDLMQKTFIPEIWQLVVVSQFAIFGRIDV